MNIISTQVVYCFQLCCIWFLFFQELLFVMSKYRAVIWKIVIIYVCPSPLLPPPPPLFNFSWSQRWPFSQTPFMQNMTQNSNLQETNVHRIAITRKVYRSNEYETHNKNMILRISVRAEGEQCFEMSLHFCHHIKTLDYECCWNRSYILSSLALDFFCACAHLFHTNWIYLFINMVLF